jgi:SEC-C motif-containing protein
MTAVDPIPQPCPCGSGRGFAECCGPYLAGRAFAPTAEALMRSRYSAYVESNEGYLVRTWHPRTRPDDASPEPGLRWLGLEVRHTRGGGVDDDAGTVEFAARFEIRGKPGLLHETSRFVKEHGHWFYLDGKTGGKLSARSQKTGRNAPCPCGSGRKYKLCCGR